MEQGDGVDEVGLLGVIRDRVVLDEKESTRSAGEGMIAIVGVTYPDEILRSGADRMAHR